MTWDSMAMLKKHLVKQQDQSPKSQMNSTLSKQATRSQETSQTSLHHELPMTGERLNDNVCLQFYSFHIRRRCH